MAAPGSILSWQPLKGFYTLGAVGFELLRLPLWLVKYAFQYGRQHPNWTFRQALGLRMLYSLVYHSAIVKIKEPLPHTPGSEKERFILIEAADSKYYKGPLVSNEDVKPVKIGATWYPEPLTASSDKSDALVIFHIHGGAYVTGDGRTAASGFMASKLLKHTPATHMLAPQYRLSKLPVSKTSNPFPAALQDSLTTYLYLLNDLKIPAKNIILSGDSAGANCAIALLRYLANFGSELSIPDPSAAWLWSPWVQPSYNATTDFTRTNKNFTSDYLAPNFTLWGTYAFAGLKGTGILDDPYISSKYHPFKSDVPMWVNVGDAELLLFDNLIWVENMKGVGSDVEIDVEEDVPHDVLLVGNIIGMDEAAKRCAEKAGKWVEGLRK